MAALVRDVLLRDLLALFHAHQRDVGKLDLIRRLVYRHVVRLSFFVLGGAQTCYGADIKVAH